MFTQIVLIQQFRLHTSNSRVKQFCLKRHKRQFFQYHRVVDGVERIGAPSKGTVAVNQNGRNIVRRFSQEGLNDHIAGFLFIFSSDFCGRHLPGAGYRSVEIVAVGGAIGRNVPSSLRPRGCPAGVCVPRHRYLGTRCKAPHGSPHRRRASICPPPSPRLSGIQPPYPPASCRHIPRHWA